MQPDRSPWQNPRVLTTLLLVFASGAIAGALTMRLGLQSKVRVAPAGPAWTEDNKQIFLQKFKSELNLSPEQAGQLTAVLEDYTMYYKSLEDQLADVRASGKTRILEILDAEQKKKFERMLADMKVR
ncbi:MAG: hypothetical protein K2X35_05940 [Bryobacteraceae bacterium]|nr:hypothetical protein [Bryobacteraceae bacterium]